MSYPPHVEAKRRKYGLPVTPAEHAAYEHGETTERPVTIAQMARALREVAPSAAPALRAVFVELAGKLEQRVPISPQLAKRAGPLGQIILAAVREPGEDEDERPQWWDR